MHIIRTNSFARSYKKLHPKARAQVDHAVALITENPNIGTLKTANLRGLRVYKFRMVDQLTLLAYSYEEEIITLTLLAFGPHENFYRDLKHGL